YKYPAKFIPQVIAYVLKEYGKPGMKIFDPFAGYGTVGVVAKLYGFDYEMWDLNPIIDVIHHTATMATPKIDVIKLMNDIKKSNKEFKPRWSNLEYWFPNEFIPLLAKAWGFVHSLKDDTKYILLIPLLKVTKYFSYGDENVHKLYRSRYAKDKIAKLIKSDWQNRFYKMLQDEVCILLRKISEYNQLHPRTVDYKIRFGIDTLNTNLEDNVNLLITSPPYLQAQEYIRSTKIELFWLGYDEEYIKELSKREIPYRLVNKIKISSDTFFRYRKKIKETHLLALYDRYFYAILDIFTRLGEKVTDRMFIFVGPAKIRAISIPLDDIITEHLSHYGWRHEVTYIDQILSHVMFQSDVNPATGIKDSRIKTEHLVVLKKNRISMKSV
ncbi:MAG: hypothetical protein N2748_02190, partial [candidate division WOR-3 bacterium]|nr:hypothetical protein [candidate division WOR-3 bacterium]